MATTYELTLRFESESDTVAACLAHELVMCLRPVMGTALATNPRIWSMDATPGSGAAPHTVGNDAYQQAATHQRDLAHRYVHAYTAISPSRYSDGT